MPYAYGPYPIPYQLLSEGTNGGSLGNDDPRLGRVPTRLHAAQRSSIQAPAAIIGTQDSGAAVLDPRHHRPTHLPYLGRRGSLAISTVCAL